MTETMGQRRDRERELAALEKIAAALALPLLREAERELQMESGGDVTELAGREVAADRLNREIDRAEKRIGVR